MTKKERYKAFALQFAFETGNQMRLLFDQIENMRLRAETAEAVIAMVSRRLGECHEGNLLQRVDILRDQERCLTRLVSSIADKSEEVVYAYPDDAFDLTDILEQSRVALDMKAC